MPPVPLRTHFQHTLPVDVPRQHGASGSGFHRQGFPGHGGGIQHGETSRYHTVQRNAFAGAHFNQGAGQNLGRRNVIYGSGFFHMDGLRPQTHQFAYGPAGAAHRTFLKVLSHAVEQHHPHRLGIIPQEHRPQGSNTHQKIFIDGAAAHHPQKGGLQYIPAYQQVGAHVGGHTGQGIAARRQRTDEQGNAQHGGNRPDGVSGAATASRTAASGTTGSTFRKMFVGMFRAHDLSRLYACLSGMASPILAQTNKKSALISDP